MKVLTRLTALLAAAVMVLPMAAMAETTDTVTSATQTATEITDEQGAAWAEAHGYVKMETDAVTSATEKKVGGVNYGAIEWTTELQEAAVREFLKGGTYLGDASYAQDESGYNYREMYQLATSRNNIPSNTNLEMVLDASNLHLLGVSEAGTSKTQDFKDNPKVSVSWVRQLRVEEEETYNYYCSYGVQYNGTVKIYTADDLATEEGQNALLNLYDKYYPTLASSWATYSAKFADAADETAVKEAKLAYITSALNAGSMVIYEIIPDSIVITAPFLMNMSPTMANAARFTQVQDGEDKYAYDLCLSDSFIDKLIAYKNDYLATEEGVTAVTEYYSSAMYQQLDQYCAVYGASTSLELALMTTNAAGLKTQTTWKPAE